MVKKIGKKLKKKEEEIVEKELGEHDIVNLPKEIELERGHKEGKITALEEEKEALEEEMSPSIERQEIARFLNLQKQQLQWREFGGALSLLKLFFFIINGKDMTKLEYKEIKGKINLLSHNKEKVFGLLHDIVIRRDGKLSIFGKIGDISRPLSTGENVSHLFWDYEGLSNSAMLRSFELALDGNGNFAENWGAKQIPQIIVDSKGEYHISKFSEKKFMKQLIEKQIFINELFSMLEMAHDTLSKVGYEMNLTQLISKLNRNRRQTAEALVGSELKQTNEIIQNWRDMSGELAVKSQQDDIKQKKLENMENVRDEILGKLQEVLGSSPVEIAIDSFEETANFLNKFLKGKEFIERKEGEKIEEDEKKTRLTKKFDILTKEFKK